jgi:hypothetical protein
MSKFDSNPNFQTNKFETPSVAKFGLTSSQLTGVMSSSVAIWELEGLSESDYYVKHPITPAWEILKISKEDWEESLKPKIHTTEMHVSEEETEELKLESITQEIIEEEIQPVKDKVNKLEKKLKTLNKIKSNKWN